MIFLKIIKEKKFILISTFLFLYVGLNLFDGQRGLISYFEKQKVKEKLIKEEKLLLSSLSLVELKNNLLTDVIDLDYLEILYREKFMLGKSKETIYKN
jgi:cell division protein DivIC